MGSVRKRKDSGKWEARWYGPDGKQQSENFSRKGDATRHVTEMEHSKHSGTYVDHRSGQTPFVSAAEAWYKTTDGLKLKTRAGYRSILKYHLLPSFGAMSLSQIDTGTIDEFIAELDGASGTSETCFGS